MINKCFSFIAFGAIFALFPLIIFYGGIFVNYFAFYGIKEYFNSFFMSSLNGYLYLGMGVFCGFAFVLEANFFRFLYLVVFIVFSLTMLPNIGKEMGERIFAKNTRLVINGKSQNVRLIYRDKYKIYYKIDKEILRLNLKKGEI